MSIDAVDLDLEELKQQAGFAAILAGYLESGVSILDQDLNYIFISDSVYETLSITHDELEPGDSLSKCHELMAANGMLTPEMLEQQALSSKEQIERNNSDQAKISRLVTLGDGSTYRFVRKPLPCGNTISIADNVSELVEKDKLLDKALSLGEAGYWSLDVATKTYTISKSLYEFFGETVSAKIKAQGIIAGIHPDDRVGFRAALKNSSQTNNRFTMTCRAFTDKSEEHWTDIRGEIIRDLTGKAIRLEAFVKDVTVQREQAAELERAKDEAIAASHAKSEFLANMSHEIRTPMNGILGMAELLSSSEINDRQREFVSVINSSASALLAIINDILDFSKIEAGAFEIDPISFDLKSSINDVASLVLGPAQEKNLELIINYSSDLPKNFIGDAGRIRQIITNLVGNAVKFTEKGHITIDVDIQTNRSVAICTVDVKDTGIGICAEKIGQIFEKFTQADGSTTRVYGGTGLGLTISKRIVEMMGGRMRVESALGEGSSFGFRIPLPIDTDAKAEAYDSSLVANKRALIVDDININRSLFGEQLRAWKIESDTAVDGVEALTKMKKAQDEGRPYDLILLDFLMPGMNGHEFAQFISNTVTIKSPQIIMLSSCDQPVSTAALNKIGIDSYLIKPVRERRLFDTIVRSLSKKTESIAAQTLEVEANVEQTIVKTTTSKKQEVLVAEDFDLNQDVVKLMLGETLFQPIFVNNGQEAVDLYCENPDRFPLILMDVSMPIMDGYQATQSIRVYETKHNLTPVSIVALTGHALKNDREDCLKSGMNDYLTKPVKQTALLDKLEFYINKTAETRQTA